jgi:hypothetical protein
MGLSLDKRYGIWVDVSMKKITIFFLASIIFLLPTNFSHADDNARYNNFLELENKIDSIPKDAWQNSQLKQGFTPVPNVSLIYGPNSKDDWSEGLESIANVSNLFSKYQQPKFTYIYFYNISDVDWADKKIEELLNDTEEKHFKQNNGGEIANSICPKLCTSAMQFTPYDSGQKVADRKSIILIGTDVNLKQKYSAKKALFSHEYFHSLQRISLHDPKDQINVYAEYPPTWFSEGTASFMENVSQNNNSYESYLGYRKFHYERHINRTLTKSFFDNFLNESNLNSDWQRFNHEGMYEVGMRVVEILVAAGGIESIMNVYIDMAKGNTFLQSFNNVYGIKWTDAKVVMSKILVSKIEPKVDIYEEVIKCGGGGGIRMRIFVAA